MNAALLQQRLKETPSLDYPCASRIHPLRSFPPNTFVKREDELGFGISGMKIRKYRTLLPYLILNGCKEAVLIGGPFSNHILSMTQLLIENGIRPILFLRGPKLETSQGNFLFLQMLGPKMHWIRKEDWPRIETLVSEHLSGSPGTIAIPEGGSLFPSFLGALTLPLDIDRNEEEKHLRFDSIFLDVGTGWSAAALAIGLAFLGKQTHCHFLLLADGEDRFRELLCDLHARFESWIGMKSPFPERLTCHRPMLAPSFGSTNQTLFDSIVQTAGLEGFFLDPIYSGKLFYCAKELIKPDQTTLLIHSGGGLTLAGFQHWLAKSV